MTSRPLFGFALALTLAASMPVAAQPAKDAPVIQIGLVKQFFNDVPDVYVGIAVEPFGDLMKEATGFKGELSHKHDAFEIARKLEKGEFQIGVFHGHEFAWLQKQYPKLRPLMLAVNQYNDVRAYVLVNKNNPASDFKGLRGKTLDVPLLTKEHCHIYLEKACSDNAQQGSKSYFKSIVKSGDPIKAIDNVISGKSEAVLVDTIALHIYKTDKGPAFEKYVKVLVESPSFPAPVIAYKDGALPEAMLKKFRTGLADAHNNANGADILRMWQIDRFLPIPADYSKGLADSLQRYPLPAAAKVQSME